MFVVFELHLLGYSQLHNPPAFEIKSLPVISVLMFFPNNSILERHRCLHRNFTRSKSKFCDLLMEHVCYIYILYLEPETFNYKWLFQLDDSNFFIGNGCLTKHPLKTGCLEFQLYMPFRKLTFLGVSVIQQICLSKLRPEQL